MATINIEDQGGIAILRLNNGVTNAISAALVNDMQTALEDIKIHYKGIILAGGEKFFSMGLNLPELLQMDREALGDFWTRFNNLIIALYTLPLPVVCAIRGHAIAGGTILALTADYRFAGVKTALMGLNEIQLGVPVPYIADLMLRRLIGDRTATNLTYFGDFMSIEDAATSGIIDTIHSPENLEAAAVEKVRDLSALPEKAFAVIKANRTESVRLKFEKYNDEKNGLFLNCWYDGKTQRLLKEAAAKF